MAMLILDIHSVDSLNYFTITVVMLIKVNDLFANETTVM